jgi:hypothetical protein
MDLQTPITWLKSWLESIAWPALVAAAFWIGRLYSKLEARLKKAERRLEKVDTTTEQLAERHMPAIHRALFEIRGMLKGK